MRGHSKCQNSCLFYSLCELDLPSLDLLTAELACAWQCLDFCVQACPCLVMQGTCDCALEGGQLPVAQDQWCQMFLQKCDMSCYEPLPLLNRLVQSGTAISMGGFSAASSYSHWTRLPHPWGQCLSRFCKTILLEQAWYWSWPVHYDAMFYM